MVILLKKKLHLASIPPLNTAMRATNGATISAKRFRAVSSVGIDEDLID